MSLQDLATRSGVSKSMLSKIERLEKNPTLQLAAQIAEGLGTTLSVMLVESEKQPVMRIRPEERVVFRDEVSGFERHLLSPGFLTNGVEFILNIIPCGQKSALFPPHRKGVVECLFVAQGRLRVELGGMLHELDTGDAFYFEADVQHRFVNTGPQDCRYYLVINSSEAAS